MSTLGNFKGVIVIVICCLALSCKAKKLVTDESANIKIATKSVIKEHYQNHIDFKTIRGKMKVDYSDGEESKGGSISFRLEKNKAIWMSAPLGLVKVYITPDRVSFYNKLESEYFDGNFSYLSNLLGTPLDFEQVQNLLLGQALFDLREDKYTLSIKDEIYQLNPKKSLELFQTVFQIEPKNFKMATQKLSQPLKKRLLEIKYSDYQQIDTWVLPNTVIITAIDGDVTNTITIDYKNIEFDQQLSFPYKIPKGYKEIVLKNK